MGDLKYRIKRFLDKAKLKHNNKYNYSLVNYINAHTKVIILCPTHGEFEQRPHRHLQGDGCKESKLEKIIRNLLDKNNFNYIQGYSKKDGGDWLGNQSIDFYLPNLKIAIECQGEQHFKPVDFGNKGSEFETKQYEINKIRDGDKYNKCVKNNINLIYYTDLIEYINETYLSTIYANTDDLILELKRNEYERLL